MEKMDRTPILAWSNWRKP